MLNWAILKNPLNWFIIWAVLIGWALFFHLIEQQIYNQTSSNNL